MEEWAFDKKICVSNGYHYIVGCFDWKCDSAMREESGSAFFQKGCFSGRSFWSDVKCRYPWRNYLLYAKWGYTDDRVGCLYNAYPCGSWTAYGNNSGESHGGARRHWEFCVYPDLFCGSGRIGTVWYYGSVSDYGSGESLRWEDRYFHKLGSG